MATRTYTAEYKPRGVVIVTWAGLLNTDDGAPFECAAFNDICAQVAGTAGAGGSVAIEGTNWTNLTNFVGLHDPPSSAVIALTAANPIEQVLEVPYAIRPHVTAGDGTTDLTVKMRLATTARR